MTIEIKKLTPDLAEDYVNFFDVTPHSEIPDSDDCKCYCVWWCNDDHDANNIDYLLSREKRRNYAIIKIKENKIQGDLTYHDGKVVGWCNANTKEDYMGPIKLYEKLGFSTSYETDKKFVMRKHLKEVLACLNKN